MTMSNPKPNSWSNLFSNQQFWKIDNICSFDIFDKRDFGFVGIKSIVFFSHYLIMAILIFSSELG